MVYSTSRCPKCGKVIRRQTNPTHEIGNPFERCRWCGNVYLNSYKEEWITKSPIKRFFFYLQVGVWARAFLIPILILTIPMAAFDMSTEAVWVLWPIMSIAWLIGGYFIHKKAEYNDIVKSIERTKDTEYLNMLKKAGYTIYPVNEYDLYHNNASHQNVSPPQSSVNKKSQEDIIRSLFEEPINSHKSTETKTEIKHICLSNETDIPDRKHGEIYSEDIVLQKSPSPESQEKVFSADIIADGLAELCIKQLLDIMNLCHKRQVSYNEKKLVIATFSYFFVIWVFNYGNITMRQYDEIEEIYKKHFCNFNRKQFEDQPFKDVLENESIFFEQLKRVDKRVRESYHAHNRMFVDDGISDEYILEFVENADDKNTIKEEIVCKILKDWAYIAQQAGKQSSVKN